MSIIPPPTEGGFVSLLKEFRGEVFGLAGVLLGALLAMCFQRWGRVRMFVVTWGVYPEIEDDKGNRSVGQNFTSAKQGAFNYYFQFSNSKPHTLALREGAILFKKGSRILHRREVFSELNIGPGTIESVMDNKYIDGNVVKEIRECDRIEFVATKPNGRKLTKHLSDVPNK